MNEKLDQHDEMEIIESIITTFQVEALEDLQSNRRSPGAAGVLLTKILDDFSGFLFTGNPRERVDRFVETYLPQFGELAVYDSLNRSLFHNYVVQIGDAGSLAGVDLHADSMATYEKLPLEALISALEKAFCEAFEDLRNNAKKRQLALERYQTHKVYFWPSSLFSEAQQKKICDYYLPLLGDNPFFDRKHCNIELRFSAQKEKNYLITVFIWEPGEGKGIDRIPLDIVIGWMGWKKVEDVLREV